MNDDWGKQRCDVAVDNGGGWLRWRTCKNTPTRVVRVVSDASVGVFGTMTMHICPQHARILDLDERVQPMLRMYLHGEGDPPSCGGYMQWVRVVEVIS